MHAKYYKFSIDILFEILLIGVKIIQCYQIVNKKFFYCKLIYIFVYDLKTNIMKKILFISIMLIVGLGFGQNKSPFLEAEGQLVKATYYYENGTIQQVGYFKDGKLEGKWTSYDVNGNLQVIAEYKEGKKTGKWLYYSNSICVNEINFSNNQILNIRNSNQIAIADKN